jgi:hypothetical protein
MNPAITNADKSIFVLKMLGRACLASFSFTRNGVQLLTFNLNPFCRANLP